MFHYKKPLPSNKEKEKNMEIPISKTFITHTIHTVPSPKSFLLNSTTAREMTASTEEREPKSTNMMTEPTFLATPQQKSQKTHFKKTSLNFYPFDKNSSNSTPKIENMYSSRAFTSHHARTTSRVSTARANNNNYFDSLEKSLYNTGGTSYAALT